MTPYISVIMPVYNQRKDYLQSAIESILHQTFLEFELLIIDDCSTDADCVSILKRFSDTDPRITVIRNTENSGVAKSLNKGIRHARSPIIARMDSDDISLPNRLEKQYSFLMSHPETDLIGCWAEIIDSHGKIIGSNKTPSTPDKIQSSILITNPLIHPTWMFRKNLMETEGYYSETSPATEDYEFLLRITRKKTVQNLPEILFRYRFNHNGVSYKKNKFQEWQSIKLRVKAIWNRLYPAWEVYKIIPSLILFLFIPFILKSHIIRFKQKHSS